jgi:hypothetical protein
MNKPKCAFWSKQDNAQCHYAATETRNGLPACTFHQKSAHPLPTTQVWANYYKGISVTKQFELAAVA